MLNNNNHKNSICAYGETLVAYLYDEASTAEKSEFESHLKTCAACVEELAEFGLAQTAIRDWRSLEFDTLATPIFEIPANEVKSFTPVEKPRSWFDGWKQIFAFRPALAMSALAIAVVLFGAALIVFNLNSDKEVAQENADRKSVKAAVSPTISIAENVPTVVNEFDEKSVAPTEKTATKIADKKFAAPRNSAVGVSANVPVRSDSADAAPVRTIQNTSKGSQKLAGASNASKSTVPRLTDAEEEEDNSVRLADLFDEIGTR